MNQDLPIAQPLRFDSTTQSWCYGCGCNNSRKCVSVPATQLLLPIVGGVFHLDNATHVIRVGYINILATPEAVSQAVERKIGLLPSASDLNRYQAIRAF